MTTAFTTLFALLFAFIPTENEKAFIGIDFPATDLTLECDQAQNQSQVDAWIANHGGAVAFSTCNPVSWSNDYVAGSQTGSCGGTGTVEVIFTATDNCGDSATTSATIVIEDTTQPIVLIQPLDVIVECDGAGNLAELNTWLSANGGANASDECGTIVWSNDYTEISDSCGETGSVSVVFRVTDQCDNYSEVTATFTIEDTMPGSITNQATDLNLECDGNGNTAEINAWLAAYGGANFVDNCSSTFTVSNDYSGVFIDCGALLNTLVNFSFEDECGLQSVTSANIIIVDTQNPIIESEAVDFSVECGDDHIGQISFWLLDNGGATASDICGLPEWTHDYTGVQNGCGETGSALVTFTATDECGNTSTTQATVTTFDAMAPFLFSNANDLVIECDNLTQAGTIQAWLNNNGGASADDFCASETLMWTNDYVLGSEMGECGDSGFVLVTFTVSDPCGNFTTTTATITVNDTTPPIIQIEANDLNIECDGSGNFNDLNYWALTAGGAIVSESCGGIFWTNDLGNLIGQCGYTATSGLVTFRATDDCGNYSETQATFNIVDSTPPNIITNAQDLTLECNPEITELEFQNWIENLGSAEATDDCSESITWSSEVTFIGSFCNNTIEYRLVTFTATDECGNFATTNASFTIEDTTAPQITVSASDEVVECDGSGNLLEINAWLSANAGATAEDECSDLTWVNDFNGLSDDCGGTGSVTVAFTASDACANSSVTYATFTIVDTSIPTFVNLPSDLILECNINGEYQTEIDSWLDQNGGATGFDICSANNLSWTNNYLSGSEFLSCNGSEGLIVTFTLTDGCGLQTEIMASIIIQDSTGPVFSIGAQNEIIECSLSGNAAIYSQWLNTNGGALATDNCSMVTYHYVEQNVVDNCAATSSTNVIFYATDECQNSSSSVAVFTIEDTSTPIFEISPVDINLECDGNGNLAAIDSWLTSNGGAIASDDCGSVSWLNDFEEIITNCSGSGESIVTYTATDACGNFSTLTASITIEDTTAPFIDNQANGLMIECDGNGNIQQINQWLDSHGGASATDVCSMVTWSNNYITGSVNNECGATGLTAVTFMAFDDCGNVSETSATIVIVDTIEPTIASVANDLTLECDGNGNGTDIDNWLSNNGGAAAIELCGDLIWSNDFTTLSDDCGGTGQRQVVFTVEDECGNASTTTATITIEDTIPPIIESGAEDLNLECHENSNPAEIEAWLNNLGGAVASDLCSTNLIISHDYIQGAYLNECGNTGSTVVNFTFTDDCGNASLTTATIRIDDNTSPTITTAASNLTLECTGGSSTQFLIEAWLLQNGQASATDVCGDVIWTNDYESLSDDCGETGEREVIFTATDGCGNSSTTVAHLYLVDTTSPTILITGTNLVLECDGTGQQNDLNDWLEGNGGAMASDECGTISWTNDFDIETSLCGGSFEASVNFTATDECGLFSTTSASFSIVDTTPPTIQIEAVDLTTECDGNGNVQEINSWLNSIGGALASDVCSNVIWTHDYTPGSQNTGCVGSVSVEVTFSAFDGCQNVATTSGTINIFDSLVPDLLIPATDITLECDGTGNSAELNIWLNNNGGAEASDLCGDYLWSNNFSELSDDCGETGQSQVIFTVEDACGNSSTTMATITIEDTTAPFIDIEAEDLILNCGSLDNPSILENWLNTFGGSVASDLCSSTPPVGNHDYISGSESNECGDTGSTIVNFIFTDECGLTSFSSAILSIVDETSPMIVAQASNLNLECSGEQIDQDIINIWLGSNGESEAEDACGSVIWSNDFESLAYDCGGTGLTEVIFTATDDCGNFTTTTGVITISDTTSPTITVEAIDQNFECNGTEYLNDLAVWLEGNGGANAEDECGDLTWSNDFTDVSPLCGSTFEVVVIFKATDDCGNFSTTIAGFTVVDNLAPIIITEASSETVECDGEGNQAALMAWLINAGGAVASDACSDLTWEYTLINESSCGLTGEQFTSFIVTDACGNSTSTDAVFNIEDTTSPEIEAYNNTFFIECSQNLETDINNWLNSNGTLIAEDLCTQSALNWTNNYTGISNGCAATGSTLVTFEVSDECQNFSSATIELIIQDTTNPTIVTQATDLNLECVDGQMDDAIDSWIEELGGAFATDACSGLIWSNDYEGLTEECGSTGFAMVIFSVTDDCGNVSTTQATINIDDTIAPIISGEGTDLAMECDTQNNQQDIEFWLSTNAGLSAEDACGIVSWTNNFEGILDYCNSEIQVTFTATDDCGNTSTHTQEIVMVDTQSPVFINLAESLVVECDGEGNEDEFAEWLGTNGYANVVDFCGEGFWENDFVELSDDCGGTGTTLVNFVALDLCGNSSLTSASFTIVDVTAPEFITPAEDLVVECNGAGNIFDLIGFLNQVNQLEVNEQCSGYTLSNDFSSFNQPGCGSTGAAVVTFFATDDCGNIGSTQATITILDTQAPMISMPAENVELVCNGVDEGFDLWIENNGGAEASDVCGAVAWSHEIEFTETICGSSSIRMVTFIATDLCQNTSTTQASYSIVDNTAPNITIAASDLTVECDSNTNGETLELWLLSNGGASAEDSCGEVIWSNNYEGLSNGCGETGTATVTFFATDACQNVSSSQASFTIEDTSSPVITIEAEDMVVECNEMGNGIELELWLLSNGGAIASDLCGEVFWTFELNGIEANCDITQSTGVVFTVTDDCGNTTSTFANFTITALCVESLELTGSNDGTGTNINNNAENIASGIIATSQELVPGASIIYNSGTLIDLLPGFDVPVGVELDVFIEGCENSGGGN